MADYLPQATGNWSTTTWITAFSNLTAFAGGNLPPASIDDVYTDGKSITIDTNIFVNSLRTTTSPRTGGLAGGGFFINNNVSLTANSVIPGTTNCLTFLSASPSICTVTGNISGSATTANAYGLLNNSSGTINLFGSILGGSVTNGTASFNNSTGNINIVGNITGGSGQDSRGLRNNTTGNVSITGNVFGGSGGSTASDSNTASGIQNIGGGNIFVLGNVIGGINTNAYGILNSSTGTVNITGICRTGQAATGFQAIYTANASTGLVTIFGTISGSNVGTSQPVVLCNSTNTTIPTVRIVGDGIMGTDVRLITNGSTGVFTMIGNLTGGNSGNGYAILNNSSGTVYLTGNALGGSGSAAHAVYNSSTGSAYVYGTATGGLNGGAGITNNTSGLIYATKVVGNAFGLGSVGIPIATAGILNTQNGRAYVEQVEFGSRGCTPVTGPVYILPSNRNTLTGRLTALGNTVTFYNSLSVDGLLPPVSSVQAGVVYNVGNSVGTMAVPSASAVQFGVPVDNTVGTAALQPQDVWGYARLSATEVDSMGDRLRNTATTQSIGYQIASFNL